MLYQQILPVRKGRSSVRVLSTPNARAIVDSFLMLFSRNWFDKRHSVTFDKSLTSGIDV